MKNFKLLVAAAVMCMASVTVSAQSLKDILTETAKTVVASATATKVTAQSLAGTWKYVQPATKFKSDDLLAQAGGAAVSASVDSKLSGYFAKVGIKKGSFSFTFDAAGNFTAAVGTRKLTGTYTVNDNGTVTLFFKSATGLVTLGRSTMTTSISGSTLIMTVDGSKMLSLMQTLTSLSSRSATMSAINTLSKSYTGLMVGFELSK